MTTMLTSDNSDMNVIYSQTFSFDELNIFNKNLSNEIVNNTIPKIKMSNDVPKFIKCNKDTYIIYINPENDIVNQLFGDNKMNILNRTYKIFLVNLTFLHQFINDVLNTVSKYVYPVVFVNFVKSSVRTNKKISFDNDELLKLRIWSNQLRITYELKNKHNERNNAKEFDNDILYIGYVICCEILYYYNYIHK